MRSQSIALLTLGLVACSAAPTTPGPTPSSASSSAAPSQTVNTTGLPLSIPEGFTIETFAKNLPGARDIAQDGFGNFWVSQTGQGLITQLEVRDGKVGAQNPIFRGLNKPHGLAVDPERGMMLFFAEENRIARVALYSDGPIETIYSLPAGGRHFTRTLGFGPDGRLYVSIGSTCDVCEEKDKRIAAILSMDQNGDDVRTVATGLRNAVFFTWSHVDGRMWATEMGRDFLGDTLPPDEVNVIVEGKNYGWPFCYGKQVRDEKFEPEKAIDCTKTEPSMIDLPAHVAPLGLAFIPEEGWPEDMWYDLLVAEHGSWNSSVPVGYKVVRIPLDAQGNVEGPAQDFLSGFTPGKSALGRPVEFHIQPGGTVYITDDKAGVIYRMRYNRE